MPRLTPITKREQVSGDGLKAFDAPQSMHISAYPDFLPGDLSDGAPKGQSNAVYLA